MVDVSPLKDLRGRVAQGQATRQDAIDQVKQFFASLSIEDAKDAAKQMSARASSKAEAIKRVTDRMLDAAEQFARAQRVQMNYRVKSVSKNGSFFGRFKSLDEAQSAADEANAEQKNGATDWEPEEKAGGDTPFKVGDKVTFGGYPFTVTYVGVHGGGVVKIEGTVDMRKLTPR